MPATVAVNQLTVVHKESNGMVTFMPDVCKTPAPPGSPIPIPYPNIALSQDTDKGTKDIQCDGNPVMVQGSCFSKSSGDEAGSVGGVVSNTTKGAAEFVSYSFDVMFEGKPVARALDMMLGNKGGTFNTPPMAEVQPPQPAMAMLGQDPNAEPDKLTVLVVDQAGNALKDVRYVLEAPDGTKKEGKTDSSGKVTLDKTTMGMGWLAFPDLPLAKVRI